MYKIIVFIAITVLFHYVGHKSDGNSINYERSTSPDSALKNRLSFPLGAAVKIRHLRENTVYRNTLKNEFNSITAENSMKFEALQPNRNVYRWTNADYIVEFANKNNIRIHGHVLHWPKANPKWVLKYKGDSAILENILKSHIQTVMNHFKGKVRSWDVVNEVFDDDGKLKQTFWLKKLGPDYIGRCFQYARAVDSKALLFYNDYGQEYSMKKRHAIANMVASFKKRGIPIDGIGLQMHTRVGVSEAKIRAAIGVLAKTGLKLHISELEISARSKKTNIFKMEDDLEHQQAEKYNLIFKTYNTIPAKQRFGITTWNVSDADSWKNTKNKYFDFPLLFDHEYRPKEAYRAILKGLE